MKIILMDAVADLGKKGDVVDVADGYARNYLLPKSLAVKASRGSLRQAEAVRVAREDAERKAREELDRLKGMLVGTRVVIAARAGDEGKLFGSIGNGDISEAIKRFIGVEIDRKKIEINEPIRSIGLHEVTVHLHHDVSFPVSLDVIPA
ncbi:MAG: 50S ribosomal protein L9 [Acidimicrobiia bacterium]|nr:50S ribosomal protein L9 [Acidimicrobiia bacterium]